MELKCKKCDYDWNYKGANPYWATCPRCITKVKVGDLKK